LKIPKNGVAGGSSSSFQPLAHAQFVLAGEAVDIALRTFETRRVLASVEFLQPFRHGGEICLVVGGNWCRSDFQFCAWSLLLGSQLGQDVFQTKTVAFGEWHFGNDPVARRRQCGFQLHAFDHQKWLAFFNRIAGF
jgi:hypothetical protein